MWENIFFKAGKMWDANSYKIIYKMHKKRGKKKLKSL